MDDQSTSRLQPAASGGVVRVYGVEESEIGLLVIYEPYQHLAAAGMRARVASCASPTEAFPVLDSIPPTPLADGRLRRPAFWIPRCDSGLFSEGAEVELTAGNSWDLCLQAWDVWQLQGRDGVILTGVAQAVVAMGDRLVLRSEAGEERPCECVAIERFSDGSGRPTCIGERGVSLMLRLGGRTGSEDAEAQLRWAGAYPSLHLPRAADPSS